MIAPLLKISDLNVKFQLRKRWFSAVRGVSFTINPGEVVGIVGESGSGKSQVFMSAMNILAKNGQATGSIQFKGQEILNLPTQEINKIRGDRMTMVFQDPMTALNPYLTIGQQLAETLVTHQHLGYNNALLQSQEMLSRVKISEAKKRLTMYPHELSGGMRQRVMIAMALLCKPDIMIADEPTTALDVTVQAQILNLLAELQKSLNMAIAIITHDLGVVANLCDKVIVMYQGRVVEVGSAAEIFHSPSHPYTKGLLSAIPRLDQDPSLPMVTIAGQPSFLSETSKGCPFFNRCPYHTDLCLTQEPELLSHGSISRRVACHYP